MLWFVNSLQRVESNDRFIEYAICFKKGRALENQSRKGLCSGMWGRRWGY